MNKQQTHSANWWYTRAGEHRRKAEDFEKLVLYYQKEALGHRQAMINCEANAKHAADQEIKRAVQGSDRP